MKGSDFKSMIAKTVKDDDDVLIGDHEGTVHDPKISVFAGAARRDGLNRKIIIPNFNRPQSPEPPKLLPRREWPEGPPSWDNLRDALVRYMEDTNQETARGLTVNFFTSYHLAFSSNVPKVMDLKPHIHLWADFMAVIRSKYDA